MITTTMRKSLWISVLGLSLALGACDKGETDGKTAAKDTKAKDTKAKTGDAKGGDVKAVDTKAGDVEAEPPDTFDERVVKAAGLAKKIEAEPARADEILTEAGLDRDAFDALLYEVSKEPELAEQYRLARAREG
jgi:hypothetical protein